MSWKSPIWNQVEEFRQSHPCPELNSLPFDMLGLAELVLGLDLIPYTGLRGYYGVDAAITADFSGLYVDAETYERLDKLPPGLQNRLRFTIAHEIGHLVLHKEMFLREGFKDVASFIEWSESLGGQKYNVEREANEFAGRLLVPKDRLEEAFKELEAKFEGFPRWRGSSELRFQAAELLAQKFGVHPQGMLTRFCREGLWPDPNG